MNETEGSANTSEVLSTGLSDLQIGVSSTLRGIRNEVQDTINSLNDDKSEVNENVSLPEMTDSVPASGGFLRSAGKFLGNKVASSAANIIPQLRAAKLVYQNRKWITYVLIWVAFMFISGFMNIAENIKNDPVGFALSKGICLYVEGKSALECVGCQDIENKYGADPVKFGCEAVVNASKGNQIAEN